MGVSTVTLPGHPGNVACYHQNSGLPGLDHSSLVGVYSP